MAEQEFRVLIPPLATREHDAYAPKAQSGKAGGEFSGSLPYSSFVRQTKTLHLLHSIRGGGAPKV